MNAWVMFGVGCNESPLNHFTVKRVVKSIDTVYPFDAGNQRYNVRIKYWFKDSMPPLTLDTAVRYKVGDTIKLSYMTD